MWCQILGMALGFALTGFDRMTEQVTDFSARPLGTRERALCNEKRRIAWVDRVACVDDERRGAGGLDAA